MSALDAAAMVQLPPWLDALLAALVLVGAAFALIGSWGLAKLSDFLKRLHGPTKATTLGVGCVLLASSIWFSLAGPGPISLHELLIAGFLFLTAPVSAHLMIKAALAADARLRPPPPAPARSGPHEPGRQPEHQLREGADQPEDRE
ncbi:MAG: Na+/H+ antiporter subunit G [Lautropia sp.]